MSDVFRPHCDPARLIYDTFQEAAEKRAKVDWQEWRARELSAVWAAARDWAQQHGLRVPTMKDVEMADSMASGHIDYGAKLAHGVARMMRGDDNA